MFKKIKKNSDKAALNTNARLRNFFKQKNIDYIDNTNIKEDHLGIKKFYLNKRGNSVFAQNLLRYLRSKYWENINFNCFTESYDEYKSKNISEDSTDSYKENLKDIPKNLRDIVVGQLYINSKKFDLLAKQIKTIINVLFISETKLDESFPVGQFQIPGYASPFCLDRDEQGGEIMVFIKEDIPVKFLSADTKPIESLYIELNFHERKWLLSCSYNPNTLRKKCPYSELFWSKFFPHFPAFGLNTERYGVSLRIQSKCGKNADQNNSEYRVFLRSDKNNIMNHHALWRNRLKSLTKLIFKKQIWSQQNKLYQATQLLCKFFEKSQKAVLRKSKWKRSCW